MPAGNAPNLGRLLLRLLGRFALGILVIVGGFSVAGVGLVLDVVAVSSLNDYFEGHPRFLPTTPELRALLTGFERTARSLKLGETATVALPSMTDGTMIELIDGSGASMVLSGLRWAPNDWRRVGVWTGHPIDGGPNEIGVFHFEGEKLVGFGRLNPCDLDIRGAPRLTAQYRFVHVECRPLKLSDKWHTCTPQWNSDCTLTIVGAE